MPNPVSTPTGGPLLGPGTKEKEWIGPTGAIVNSVIVMKPLPVLDVDTTADGSALKKAAPFPGVPQKFSNRVKGTPLVVVGSIAGFTTPPPPATGKACVS